MPLWSESSHYNKTRRTGTIQGSCHRGELPTFRRAALSSTSPARTIFERIVDLNCVVSDDTVWSEFRTLWSAKERFYIARAAAAANQRTESSSIEVIGRRLDDVTRRRG